MYGCAPSVHGVPAARGSPLPTQQEGWGDMGDAHSKLQRLSGGQIGEQLKRDRVHKSVIVWIVVSIILVVFSSYVALCKFSIYGKIWGNLLKYLNKERDNSREVYKFGLLCLSLFYVNVSILSLFFKK